MHALARAPSEHEQRDGDEPAGEEAELESVLRGEVGVVEQSTADVTVLVPDVRRDCPGGGAGQ